MSISFAPLGTCRVSKVRTDREGSPTEKRLGHEPRCLSCLGSAVVEGVLRHTADGCGASCGLTVRESGRDVLQIKRDYLHAK